MDGTFREVSGPNSEPVVNASQKEQPPTTQISTGPKTPHGKRRSSKNAVRHGFFSKEIANVHMLDKKDQKAYSKLLADLCQQWNPVEPTELIQVQLMATHLHQYKCALRLTAALRGTGLDDPLHLLVRSPTTALDRETADQWRSVLPALDDLEKIQRYEAHCLKNYYRALLMLHQLRAAKVDEKLLPGTAPD